MSDRINGTNIYDAGNSIATSNSLNGSGTNTITGSVGGSDIADYYNFVATNTGTARLTLLGLNADIDLFLEDSSGYNLNASTEGGSTNENFSYYVYAGTPYYVRISPWDVAGSNYNLNVILPSGTVGPRTGTDSINGTNINDAGNSTATANSLSGSGNNTITGSVGGSDIDDYYKFVATNTGTASVLLFGLNADTDLYLLNSSGTILNSSGYSGSTSESLNYDVNAGNTYYVQVHPFDVAGSNYDLHVNLPAATDNTIYGTAGNDYLQAFGDNDVTIYSGAGNDHLQGFGGNDILNGGAGIDTAIFSGTRANHTIAKTAAGWTVYSSVNGFDKLSDIERLQFSDKTIALDIDGNAGQAYRVYQAAFDRTPDNSGLKYWISFMDAGNSLETVAYGFINSYEFTALYGANPTNRDYVSKLYNNVLHRTPEQGGYNYWVNLLDTGEIDKVQTLVNFSESSENQVAVMGVIEYGIELF